VLGVLLLELFLRAQSYPPAMVAVMVAVRVVEQNHELLSLLERAS
jgi:hypothetical protein